MIKLINNQSDQFFLPVETDSKSLWPWVSQIQLGLTINNAHQGDNHQTRMVNAVPAACRKQAELGSSETPPTQACSGVTAAAAICSRQSRFMPVNGVWLCLCAITGSDECVAVSGSSFSDSFFPTILLSSCAWLLLSSNIKLSKKVPWHVTSLHWQQTSHWCAWKWEKTNQNTSYIYYVLCSLSSVGVNSCTGSGRFGAVRS